MKNTFLYYLHALLGFKSFRVRDNNGKTTSLLTHDKAYVWAKSFYGTILFDPNKVVEKSDDDEKVTPKAPFSGQNQIEKCPVSN